MFWKSCAGCGPRFEAQKANRRWCSDVCGRRTRRKNARAIGRPVIPAASAYVRLNRDLADALAASLPAGLLLTLDDADYFGDCTEEEFSAVALPIAARIQDAIGCSDWSGCER